MKIFAIIACVSAVQAAPVIEKIFYHRGATCDTLALYTSSPVVVHVNQKKHGAIISFEASWKQGVENEAAKLLVEAQHHPITLSKEGAKQQIKIDGATRVTPVSFTAITKSDGFAVRIPHKATGTATRRKQACANKTCSCLPTKKPTIIIDCGHGGKDPGTLGVNNVAEKEVTLAVGTLVRDQLLKAGYNVCLTRAKDEFVALDARTSFANLATDAAIFISLHANYSAIPARSGVETYYSSDNLLRLTQTNAVLGKTRLDCFQEHLANTVHSEVLKAMREHTRTVLDRGVKQAVSQVLFGSEMPAVLIELGFLSNKREATLLTTPAYQEKIAQGVVNGVEAFFKNKPAC